LKAEVVLEDWVWEKMVPKCKLPKSIPLHAQGLNYKANVYELKDHVGERD
jgi:hypothetical protein